MRTTIYAILLTIAGINGAAADICKYTNEYGDVKFEECRKQKNTGNNIKLTYKGILFSSSKNKFISKFKNFSCSHVLSNELYKYIETCTSTKETYGDIPVDETRAYFVRGELHGISVSKIADENIYSHRQTWLLMLSKKYGKGTPITESTGIHFGVEWKFTNSEVSIAHFKKEPPSDTEKLIIIITDTSYNKALNNGIKDSLNKLLPEPKDM